MHVVTVLALLVFSVLIKLSAPIKTSCIVTAFCSVKFQELDLYGYMLLRKEKNKENPRNMESNSCNFLGWQKQHKN